MSTEPANQENGKKKDFLDILKVIGQIMTPAAIAVIGIWFNVHQARSDREAAEAQAQRERKAIQTEVYTKLLASREEAESDLRKDLFPQMMAAFFTEAPGSMIQERMLNLELMTCNFHDSIDLKPLFRQVHWELCTSEDALTERQRTLLQERLENLACSVRQIQYAVVMEKGEEEAGYFRYNGGIFDEQTGEVTSDSEFSYPLYLDGLTSIIHLSILRIDHTREEAQIRLSVDTYSGDYYGPGITVTADSRADHHALSFPTSELDAYIQPKPMLPISRRQAEFWVGPYDFPMISNMRLTNNQRCAVVVDGIDKEEKVVTFSVVLFPGCQASHKERPYIDEVINELLIEENAAQPQS